MAVLRWEGGRVSPLTAGRELGFRAEGERSCVGARGNPCPLGATVSGRATQARCPECARLDRAHSVAADTIADDPRTYRVYLAWFGPGMTKVGITAEERGPARLLEQGAVVFSWLGRGPLMAARRTEELLSRSLGVPDRVPYAEKRAVRAELPGTEAERAAETVELHRRARALDGWPETLEPLGCDPVDHAGVFGLAGLDRATCVVRELVPGGAVSGTLLAVAGPDLHLRTVDGEIAVLDTRLMSGWSLVGADTAAGLSVPVSDLGVGTSGGGAQDGLF
ncbi:DUF2797 domain-containing protein [Streptomyces sp. NPDC000594]|uniref:DUF2797 domain-containing protein n=1 Tax=Streptomyces sp. NPDC000594 TaxID=3154261 RepID=UPI003317F2D0